MPQPNLLNGIVHIAVVVYRCVAVQLLKLMDEEEDRQRRSAEFLALGAIYDGVLGDDADGPWQIPLGVGSAMLEVHLPADYPSTSAPTPVIFAPMLSDEQSAVHAAELLEMFDEVECVFTWVAHLKEALEINAEEMQAAESQQQRERDLERNLAAAIAVAAEADHAGCGKGSSEASGAGDGFTYTPPTSKYGQRVRHFGSAATDERWRVDITSGASFHPPKGGPAESFQAHVATVRCIEQVNWAISQLLRDKKIARATHNMIAYSFVDERGVHVSDNDDDGEGGSGVKLAATIENTGAQNVLVVVSRWFGGVHLGPARFKFIASVAGALLDEQGHCNRQQGKKKS